MRSPLIAFSALCLNLALVFAGEVKFTKAPTARKAGGKVSIEFAASRETDVAVYVLNAKNEVVRHLVAGVLGKNPPKPLKAGLSQSLEWDGKDDDGKKAAGGPFKVRVAAGMTPKHGGFVFSTPAGKPYNFLGTVRGIGVAPDGSVYAIIYRAYIRATGNFEIQRFTRDGVYDGTLAPFGGQLKPKDVRGFAPFTSKEGRALPRWVSPSRFRDLPYLPRNPLVQTPAVDEKGRLLMAVCGFRWSGGTFGITSIDPDGGVRAESFSSVFKTPVPAGAHGNSMETSIAISRVDPNTVLLCGMKKIKDKKDPYFHAVFRVPLAGNGKMTLVFG